MRHRNAWLFVDPAIAEAGELLKSCRKNAISFSRIVLYTRLSTPAVARRIATFSRAGSCWLILADSEDSPAALRRPLHQAATADFRLQVVALLASPLLDAPPLLAFALTQEFLGPSTGIAGKQLALAAGMDRRSVERWLRRIGLGSPKVALSAAHLVRAFPRLIDPWVPLHVVAREHGFTSVRTLSRQCMLIFGLSPQLVRASVRQEDLPNLIYRRLTRRRSENAPVPQNDM
jgi:hypothetical protein